MRKISALFNETYNYTLKSFKGNVSQFNEFGKLLIKTAIAQRNCGEYQECNTCPNNKKDSKILQAFKEDKLKILLK